MKSRKKVFSHFQKPPARVLIRTLLVGFFALQRQAQAQYVLAPGPQPPDQTPPALQQVSEMDVFATAPQTVTQPFKAGPFTLRPHPYYQFLYADGLQYNTNLMTHSTVQTISPGALLEIGSHWTVDYSPFWTFYSSPHLSDNFGQTAALVGGAGYTDWVLGLKQTFSDVSAVTATTAGQTRTKDYNTGLTGAYTMNSKMSLDLAANQDIVSADQLASYNEWSTMNWLNYQFWPRLNAAVGAGGGYDNESASPDMSFEQFQGRVNWRATDKLGFQLHGGVEVRQFLSGGQSPLVNPIFDGTIQYQPFEQTKISVTGSRVVGSSILANEVTETTSVLAGLNQRLLGKLFLDLNGGYQLVKYIPSGTATGPERRDNYYTFNARLGCAFLKRGTVAVFYQLNQDNSNDNGFSFTSHQVGFQIGFAY